VTAAGRALVLPRDERIVIEFLATVFAEQPCAYITPGEFEHRWRAWHPLDAPPPARLWVDCGRPVGFAWLDGNDLLAVNVLSTGNIFDDALVWADEVVAHRGGAVRASAFEGDARRQRVLRARCYTPTLRGASLRARLLDDPPYRPLPHGYQIRSAGEADITAQAALYERAHAPERLPAAQQRAITQAAIYRADLDLLAVAADGALAAFATIWYDPSNRHGVFEPLGTDPAHQRRGLAAALMAEGMRRLRAIGANSVQVSTGLTRLPANRLYESLGFQLLDRLVVWEQP
jgi:ribosomal protein S18 acetylase RimI-like enzyme